MLRVGEAVSESLTRHRGDRPWVVVCVLLPFSIGISAVDDPGVMDHCQCLFPQRERERERERVGALSPVNHLPGHKHFHKEMKEQGRNKTGRTE